MVHAQILRSKAVGSRYLHARPGDEIEACLWTKKVSIDSALALSDLSFARLRVASQIVKSCIVLR